jgi:hypothetical protein
LWSMIAKEEAMESLDDKGEFPRKENMHAK